MAESVLIAALDWITTHNINDPWLQGTIHTNLAFAMQQNLKYDQSVANYGIGLKLCTQEVPNYTSLLFYFHF